MYGLGLIKGMVVTLKNLVLPSRRFTLHSTRTGRSARWGWRSTTAPTSSASP